MKTLLLGLTLLFLQGSVEERVTARLRERVKPGEPLVVGTLYNEVFTQPEERAVLDRLFNLFFKIPVFIVQEYESRGRAPSLRDLAGQFRLPVPGEVDVLLSIMESDPRVPGFFRRDPRTREIVSVNPDALRADPNFSGQLERSLSGLEGRPAPAFVLPDFKGQTVSLDAYRNRWVLLYFWFSDCPPCVQTAPELVGIRKRLAGSGLEILGLNADHVLQLGVSDAARLAYLQKQGISFPNASLDPDTLRAYGDVAIFPTMVLVGPDRVVRKQWISYQEPSILEAALGAQLGAGKPGGAGK